MKVQTLVRISGMILLAIAVSVIMLVVIYALQHAYPVPLTSVGWNGLA